MIMKFSLGIFTSILLLAVCTVQARAEERTSPVDVGEKAPAFQLTDQNGQEQSLEGLLKKGNVALVFYRSAGW